VTVVDTSAIIAIVLKEPEAAACAAILQNDQELLMSAGTYAELLIVASARNVGDEVERLVKDFGFEIVPVTSAVSRRVAEAYHLWGKGVHPAGLNFGDCFAYEAAKEQDCPLLFVGDDFPKTDVVSALEGHD
jgi:ribonuclease VapC